MLRSLVLQTCLLLSSIAAAQGQDGRPYERDFLLIDAMLEGIFSNANQSYFDRRVGRMPVHASYEVAIRREERAVHTFTLTATAVDGAVELSTYMRTGLPAIRSSCVSAKTRWQVARNLGMHLPFLKTIASGSISSGCL